MPLIARRIRLGNKRKSSNGMYETVLLFRSDEQRPMPTNHMQHCKTEYVRRIRLFAPHILCLWLFLFSFCVCARWLFFFLYSSYSLWNATFYWLEFFFHSSVIFASQSFLSSFFYCIYTLTGNERIIVYPYGEFFFFDARSNAVHRLFALQFILLYFFLSLI